MRKAYLITWDQWMKWQMDDSAPSHLKPRYRKENEEPSLMKFKDGVLIHVDDVDNVDKFVEEYKDKFICIDLTKKEKFYGED